VDPGVAHAIDTFIIYALAAVGGLAALEAVGLGVGTITVFAGAFGIGLGLGCSHSRTILPVG
jgi:small-conductance mechanosensitive channel